MIRIVLWALMLSLGWGCAIDTASLKDESEDNVAAARMRVELNPAVIHELREQRSPPRQVRTVSQVRVVENFFATYLDRMKVFEALPEVADDCESCQLRHFKKTEQPLQGESFVSCRKVREDFAAAQKLWNEVRELREQLVDILASLNQSSDATLLEHARQLVDQLLVRLDQILGYYPQNYHQIDRVSEYRIDVPHATPGPGTRERYKLAAVKVKKFAMPGGHWQTGDSWRIAGLRRLVSAPERKGGSVVLKIEESAAHACLGLAPIATRLTLTYALVSLLEPRLPGRPIQPREPIPLPDPGRPMPMPGPGFGGLSLLQDNLVPVGPELGHVITFDVETVAVAHPPAAVWIPAFKPQVCQPRPCDQPALARFRP